MASIQGVSRGAEAPTRTSTSILGSLLEWFVVIALADQYGEYAAFDVA
jgi:hypothetical protein